MSTARDALRQMEADAYGTTAPSPSVNSDFRRQEILELNASAAEEGGRKLVTWGAVALLLLLVFSSNGLKR